ncbi:MAG: 30S ribosome-binding factor RbfA [Syntrophorhabdaceae bacterium]|nr:30S ribosome-binding factor RbfA [Syntrophorhabdaceae bacterium]
MRYRRLKLQDLLREEVSAIIMRELKDPGFGFITILDVEMTEDLKNAKIYYSIYGDEKERERTGDALKRAKGYIKFLLGERLKVKYIPEITFILDDPFERVARIEELLKRSKA